MYLQKVKICVYIEYCCKNTPLGSESAILIWHIYIHSLMAAFSLFLSLCENEGHRDVFLIGEKKINLNDS